MEHMEKIESVIITILNMHDIALVENRALTIAQQVLEKHIEEKKFS